MTISTKIYEFFKINFKGTDKYFVLLKGETVYTLINIWLFIWTKPYSLFLIVLENFRPIYSFIQRDSWLV